MGSEPANPPQPDAGPVELAMSKEEMLTFIGRSRPQVLAPAVFDALAAMAKAQGMTVSPGRIEWPEGKVTLRDVKIPEWGA